VLCNEPGARTCAGRLYTKGMLESWGDLEFLRHVFENTEIVRKPLIGIIAGHHVLPYILVGPEPEHSGRSLEVRGRIRVSPRLVITPREVDRMAVPMPPKMIGWGMPSKSQMRV